MSLFDLQPLTANEIKERMAFSGDGPTVRRTSSTGKVYTVRHKPWWISLGKGPEGKTCADCKFLIGDRYKKCRRQIMTSGAGTDIRAKDEACTLYKPKGD